MIRSLHVDIEGGWGGSSRSLFELLSRLDRDQVSPLVVHRQMGPIVEEYKALDIPTVHVPEVGSYVPRPNRGGVILAQKIPELSKLPRAANRIDEIFRQHDGNLIHLNYEGLFLLGRLLKRHTSAPQVMHVRASGLANDIWTRWMVRSMGKTADHAFFITDNEERWFRSVEKTPSLSGSVLFNIARPAQARQPFDSPPEAVFLGNLDPIKGVDRLLDVAGHLDDLGAPPLKIAVYGAARGKKGFAGYLATQIEERRIAHRMELRGFVADVGSVLSRAVAVLRPSVQADPWGRDVIESLAAGVPCLATGTYAGMVEDDVTGYLFEPFDARAMALRLKKLVESSALWKNLSNNCMVRGEEKFSGKFQRSHFTNVLEQLVS